MRKLVTVLFLAAGFSCVFAQKGKVTSALNYLTNRDIEKAWSAIQEAEQHEKTVNYDKTYYAKGKVLQAIGESTDPNIQELVENPLIKAYEAYEKAISLDEKGKMQKSVDIMLPMLNNDFINLGVQKYNENDYDAALQAFEYSLSVGKKSVFGGAIDTSIIYNAGMSAYNDRNWDKATEYFTKTMDMGYGGSTVWILQKEVYLEQGDSAAAESLLQEGILKFQDTDAIMVQLINYYLTSGKDAQAFEYLKIAKEKDPGNSSYWYAEGMIYDGMGQLDNSIASYTKATELDPEYFDPYYNMGVIMFNEGVRLQEIATKIVDIKAYEVAKTKSDDAFKTSVPYFEKAQEIKPDDRATLENLKILYYRLQLLDKREEIIKKLESLEQEVKEKG